MACDFSLYFRQPVDLASVPDYSSIIQHPVDLTGIWRKIHALTYLTMEEYLADYIRLEENARLYNGPSSVISDCVNKCLEKVRELLGELDAEGNLSELEEAAKVAGDAPVYLESPVRALQ